MPSTHTCLVISVSSKVLLEKCVALVDENAFRQLEGIRGASETSVEEGHFQQLMRDPASEGQRVCLFLVHQTYDAYCEEGPVQIVRDNRAIGCSVLPTEDGVEHIPSIISLSIAAANVPDCLQDILRFRATATLGDIAPDPFREKIILDAPYRFREHACGHKVQHAGGG
ncbi:hypothetical protein K461DRAFT_316477 [Myriangium duriaei CBS 260.36]|uniref:Uncharacterized protein n=1 Tax=Myriangium duriaei CBS 260.36 TaxID=1168546 RepID=A0A9P4IWC4_9PEZI|nr:hypothetical protein K461DRAFT_316477 [Myriangium duriaei CBS 260.36]